MPSWLRNQATSIRLKSLLSDFLQKIGAAAPGDMKALQAEAGRIEDMLARDF